MFRLTRQHPLLLASGVLLGAGLAFGIDGEALAGVAAVVGNAVLDGFLAILYAPFLCA